MALRIIFIVFALLSLPANGQKYFTRSGITEFEASEKAFEPIEAINESTTAIMDLSSGVIVAQVFMAGFQFKNALMQEHFNENYMESNQYPKATFKGKLDNFSLDDLKSNEPIPLSGMLTIKGVEKKIQTTVSITQDQNGLSLTGMFSVNPEDFNIKIPVIVQEKIADMVHINLNYQLVEKK